MRGEPTIKRADWVRVKGFGLVGFVHRVAKDGSWADVDWGAWRKRQLTSVLEPLHTIECGSWHITDVTRKVELEVRA